MLKCLHHCNILSSNSFIHHFVQQVCDPFWCSTRIEISDADKNVEVYEYPLPDIKWNFNFRNQQGMQYMASAIGKYIKEGKCYLYWA